MPYLDYFISLFQWGNIRWMASIFASATIAAIAVEYFFLKEQSTLYSIYTKNFSRDLKRDFFIWVMEIIMIWPFIGRLLTLSFGVYLGSILNDYFHNLSPIKLITLVPYFWLQVILALAAGDLLFYWLHRLFHISSHFWQLHKYHHSTTTMTVFSGSRDNPVVGSIWTLLTGIPSAILGSPIGIPEGGDFPVNISYSNHPQQARSQLGIVW